MFAKRIKRKSRKQKREDEEKGSGPQDTDLRAPCCAKDR